jgi:hypothetical protein
MAGCEQSRADEPRSATGVENQAIRGQPGERQEVRQCCGITLHRRALEEGGLRVKGLG